MGNSANDKLRVKLKKLRASSNNENDRGAARANAKNKKNWNDLTELMSGGDSAQDSAWEDATWNAKNGDLAPLVSLLRTTIPPLAGLLESEDSDPSHSPGRLMRRFIEPPIYSERCALSRKKAPPLLGNFKSSPIQMVEPSTR